jgi:DNA-binding winged helix-turn-helix (wHTH) protein/TolB-like protein
MQEFGPFRYDPAQRLLFRNGEVVALEPKAVDTLHALLCRRGEVVEKAELMKLVWPDTTVEDVGLARNISILRKALGDDAGQYIETIPRRGYRFTAPPPEPPPQAALEALHPSSRRTKWLLAAGLAAVAALVIYIQFYRPSRFLPGGGAAGLAVIPFECLSPEWETTAFTRGFNETLVGELARLNGIHVVSPSTVRRYQWAGISTSLMARMLGLEVLVEGSVQQVSGRFRITARLVDVHTGKLIWAETYDRPASDPAAAQSSVPAQVASSTGRLLSAR